MLGMSQQNAEADFFLSKERSHDEFGPKMPLASPLPPPTAPIRCPTPLPPLPREDDNNFASPSPPVSDRQYLKSVQEDGDDSGIFRLDMDE